MRKISFTFKNWQVPVVAVFMMMIAILILITPLGLGKTGQYGFLPGKIPDKVQTALILLEQNPNEPSVALNAAEALLAQGRLDGNAETVAAADAILEQIEPSTNTLQVFRSRAIAQQYLHNFDNALDLLDKVLAINSNDAGALLTRTNILLVQGKIKQAKDTCNALARAIRYDLFVLCDASTKALGVQAGNSAMRLQSFTESGRMDPALGGYAFSVLGEIAMFENDNQKAQVLLAKAQQLDPENLRIRMLHADSLLKLNRFEQALETLDVPADTDALLVRRAIALKQAGKDKALKNTSRIIKSRIKANFWAGHTGHAREEALYYLSVAGDSVKALERANINWQYQREFEDAQLLLDAAKSVNAKKDAIKVSTWMQEENVTTPGLVSRLEELEISTDWIVN